jgi:hypothetical protein
MKQDLNFSLADSVLSQKLGAQTVLMHVHKGEYFELNNTGALVLDALLAGKDENAVARLLVDTFEVEHAQAISDVNALIVALRSRSLLRS